MLSRVWALFPRAASPPLYLTAFSGFLQDKAGVGRQGTEEQGQESQWLSTDTQMTAGPYVCPRTVGDVAQLQAWTSHFSKGFFLGLLIQKGGRPNQGTLQRAEGVMCQQALRV